MFISFIILRQDEESVNFYKAAIFDLDGTLVYTPPEYRQKVISGILKKLGITNYPDWFIDQFWFFGDRAQTIKDALGIEPGRFFRLYNQYDTKEGREVYTRKFDDVDYLKELKRSGCKIGAVTGGSPHVMEANINRLGRDYFNAVVSANPNAQPPLPPKPDPAGLFCCLEQLAVSPKEAFFVGNGEEDIGAAKNAGILDVLILRGEHKLPKVKASLTINSLYELERIMYNSVIKLHF